jgi:secondary thiamine-phosphate synthase enzyme
MIKTISINISSKKRGFHLITKEVKNTIGELPKNGLFHLFIQHTSAGLTINENVDPSVRIDFENFTNQLFPEDHPIYTHTQEGADDMPAHLKTSFIGSSISIPIHNHQMQLGIWQGIYLCEFRNQGGNRKLIATIIY